MTRRFPASLFCDQYAIMKPVPNNQAQVAEIVRAACDAIVDGRIRETVEVHLIEPRLQLRTWEYGEQPASYAVWIIAETGERGTGIAYSEYGHGPLDPWSLLFLDEDTFGMDCLWYKDIESLVLNMRLWNFSAPPDYEVP
jgi:hypothetical protein